MTEKWDLFSNLWTLLLHCSEIHIREKCTNGSTQKLNDMCSLVLFSTNSLDPYLLWDCMNTASFCFCQQGHEEARGGEGFVKAVAQVSQLSHGTLNIFTSLIRPQNTQSLEGKEWWVSTDRLRSPRGRELFDHGWWPQQRWQDKHEIEVDLQHLKTSFQQC